MELIHNWNEVIETTAAFHNNGLCVTNFYSNESEMSEWIEQKSFFLQKIDDKSACLLHKTEEAFFLFFYISGIAEFSDVLHKIRSLFSKETLAFDWICRTETERNVLRSECNKGNFTLHTALRRMSMVLKDNKYFEDISVTFAEKSDIDELQKMFCSAFDPISERIPTKEQLIKYIDSQSILIKRIQNEIAGFAVIDIQKKSMYLKHLLTNPKFRRQGIAESLLKHAFYLSRDCVRYILWVIETNEPAISLYKKFGYKFETLSNDTFVSK